MLGAASIALAQTAESDQVAEFVDKYEDVWRLHDAGLLAEFFAEDSDMIVGIQPRIAGRTAITSWWDQYFSRIDSGRIVSISIESISILSAEIALLNVHTTTGGSNAETSEALESRKARGTWVVTRVGGDWKIAALRMHSPVGTLREAPGIDN